MITLLDTPERKILGTARWRDLDRALGDGVLAAFCRCFAHTDRLLSLHAFGRLSDANSPESVKARDFATIIWMTIGTLHELGRAISALRSALVRAGLFAQTQGWIDLKEVVAQANEERRNLRNAGAFHIDSEIVRRGVEAMGASGSGIVIAVQQGKTDLGFSFPAGIEAVYTGIGMTPAEIERFMRNLLRDVTRVPALLGAVFSETIARAKIPGAKF